MRLPRPVLAAAVALALAGCGKSPSQSAAELAVKAATDGKVDINQSQDGTQQQVTIKTDQGEAKISSGGDLAMPAGFPTDVHLPGSAYTVTNVMQMGPTMVVTLHSGASVTALFGEYDTAMKAAGWKEAMALQSSNTESVLSFQKDDRLVTVTLAAKSDGAGTDVSLQHIVQKTGG